MQNAVIRQLIKDFDAYDSSSIAVRRKRLNDHGVNAGPFDKRIGIVTFDRHSARNASLLSVVLVYVYGQKAPDDANSGSRI